MISPSHGRALALACALVCFVAPLRSRAHVEPGAVGPAPHGIAQRDGQHDFDFEFGSWKVRLRRVPKPLTGSSEWVEMAGTSVVRQVWNGRANLGELDVENATSHIEGLSLRLYNPQSRQWSIYWANARDGGIGTAMIGQFANGRGEFFNQELFEGKAVYVRFVFSDITAATFRLEQAFSPDGGKTWGPNWIAEFTRLKS